MVRYKACRVSTGISHEEPCVAVSALVVDDSRVALVALSRMLKAYGFHVDTAESGPETLDHLRANMPPGVIFLDHMMPGMDGFETLTVLKRDPATASIPVVMYTSREGDAYMGQARTLGAAAVLHKPLNAHELAGILARLGLVPERSAATGTESAAPPIALAVTAGTRVANEATLSAGRAATDARPPPRASVTQAASGARDATAPDKAPTRARWLWPLVYVGVLLVIGVWLLQQQREAARLRAVLTEQQAELSEQRRATDVTGERLQQVQATMDAQRRTTPPAPTGWLDTLAWALNQHNLYEHDQIALSDERLLMVRELLGRLAALGFQGTVRLEAHVGEFCLVRDEQGSYRLPAPATALNRCEIVSYSAEQALSLGRRQSPAFSRFLAERAAPGATPQLLLVSHGKTRPLLPYPDPALVQTAGEWNQIARVNQRLEIVIEPAR
jgi:CheY-like chemotaxis protein